MKDKLLKIINNYGVTNQLKKLNEECYEFIEAVGEYRDVEVYIKTPAYEFHRKHMIEEFADVMVMLEQFKAYYELDNQEIMDIMEYKINRQIDRIKGE